MLAGVHSEQMLKDWMREVGDGGLTLLNERWLTPKKRLKKGIYSSSLKEQTSRFDIREEATVC